MVSRLQKGVPKTICSRGKEALGLGLCSSLDNDVVVDEEAYNIEITDTKHLSCMHWEDILRVKQGDQVVLYFRKNSSFLKESFANVPLHVAKQQKQAKIAGGEVRINGINFYVLRATLFTSNYHLPALLGQLTMKQLKEHFKAKD